MRCLPVWLVDRIVLLLTWLVLGNTESLGLKRPTKGPFELKTIEGKTPVLDIGALRKIRSGDIKIVPAVKRFYECSVELVDGQVVPIDSVIFATGYCTNVLQWLQVRMKCTYYLFACDDKILQRQLEIGAINRISFTKGIWSEITRYQQF
jgi:hypothetical protein